MKASVSADQLFNTSVGETWETIADIESYPNRTSSYTEINPLTDHLGGLGARWKQTRTVWGRNHTQTMEVVEWEPTASMALRATEAGAEYETRYLFTPVDGGTKVMAIFTVAPVSLYGRAVVGLMGKKLMASSREALAEILAELSASSSPSEE
jgi:hypothetical protein